jgi:hypothetical protein
VGFLALWNGIDVFAPNPDGAAMRQLSDQLGTAAGSATSAIEPQDVLALGVGAAVLAVVVALLFGVRWAQHALSGLGVLAVIVVALGGHWEAALIFLAFVAGAAMLLTDSAQRYLRNPATRA